MSGNVFECDVCLNGFDLNERLPKLLPCDHTYCLSCLLAIARRDSVCPYCRGRFVEYPTELGTNYKISVWLGANSGTDSSLKSASDGTRLFVARIPSQTTETDLKAVFAQYGDVKESVLVHTASSSGQTKKFGFVSFRSEASAQLALRSRPIFVHGSSKLFVDIAKPRANFMVKPSSQGSEQTASGPGYPYSHRIFAHRIPRGLSDSSLTAAFSRYGAIESVVRRWRRRSGGKFQMFAIVTFVTSDAVDRACVDKVLYTSAGQRIAFRRFRECELPHESSRFRSARRRRSPPRRVIMTRPDNSCCLVQ